LARAMGIPTVMGAVDLPYSKVDGIDLIVDGYHGEVYTNPSAEHRRRQLLADDDGLFRVGQVLLAFFLEVGEQAATYVLDVGG
ncbi:PEP-utilizing enzyme, partial [Pseudomonas aeruginosa]|uniref:PEP-utilizing enzyme n=1 Tax=Pseudomonas aeruginosa TaxID=287 RepID=UPI00117A0432